MNKSRSKFSVLFANFAVFAIANALDYDLTAYNGGIGYGLPLDCPLTYPSALNLKLPTILPSSIFPCDVDCQAFHGALDGKCDALGNCRCIYNSTDPTEPASRCTGSVCQCSNLDQREFFEQLCNVDCNCDHGANFGTCDFEEHACVCDYSEPYNGTCIARDLNNPEQYPEDYRRIYSTLQQSIAIKQLHNFLISTLKQPACLPAPLPFLQGGLLGGANLS